MKTLSLLAPDFSALDTIWHRPQPFALWRVGSQALLDHWMDEAVRMKVEEVVIYAADRPAEIRDHLAGGNFWSKRVTVVPMKSDADAPAEAVRLEHLPRQTAPLSPLRSPAALLAHWLGLQTFWLTHRDPEAVSIDARHPAGGWVGPQARIDPKAELIPPFWIGGHARIGPECRVGPNALIGENSVLDAQVEVRDAYVMPETYLGRYTRVNRAVAQGSTLIDVERTCRVEIAENFIMAPVSERPVRPEMFERLLALLAWLVFAPLALLWPGQKWSEWSVRTRSNEEIVLRTGLRGPLIVRRWPWLRRIASGHLHWFGILPREDSAWEHLAPETAQRLRTSHMGVFSWADLQGCHDPAEPEEWLHAAYQALQSDGSVRQALRRRFFTLARLSPP